MNSESITKGYEVHSKTKKIILFGALSCLLTGAFTGIPAVIMGHRALSKHRNNATIYSNTDRRVILGGIILGYIGITITIYLIIMISIVIVTHFGLWDGLRDFIKENFII